ncbi:MAG: TonB-dependent receptor, partial [Cryobacterium sp.]|nr:TonB-dependent receptor [Oligoflexia bacterium]
STFSLSYFGKSARYSSGGLNRTAGFARLDLSARFHFHRDWTFNARIENLLGRDYQEIRGYRTQGFSGYAGFEFRTL